ncbi:MAG: hypothetical protein J3Q66DRAFT_325751 [Benniella sp.]|nr:MAG: hypothetical protein J3Q66DRAFT_325751 [Benniella sp.]
MAVHILSSIRLLGPFLFLHQMVTSHRIWVRLCFDLDPNPVASGNIWILYVFCQPTAGSENSLTNVPCYSRCLIIRKFFPKANAPPPGPSPLPPSPDSVIDLQTFGCGIAFVR